MGMKFTEDQQRVIDLRNCNILVSAAAGSGKTAVLVERIVELVSGSGCDSARAVDIDRLLIVTFTNAAAAQMRERITKALSDRVEAEPDNEHIKKQLMLIHNAKIMTIHSFCLYLIKNHFNDIGLDPDFRTADEGEIRLLKQEVLSELLEEQFALGRQEFTDCVEYFAYDGREKRLEELIERLYTFSGSYPFPEKWLRQHRMDYHVETFEELVKTEWFAGMMQEISALLQECKEQEKAALKVCEEPDGPYFYAVALEQDQELIAGLEQELARVVQTASEPEQSVAPAEMGSSVAKDAFEALTARVQGISYARMAPKKDDSVSAEKRELVKAMRERVKSLFGTLSEKYFASGPKQWLTECRQADAALCELVDLALLFGERLTEKKREALYEVITTQAVSWSVTRVEAWEIDEMDILNARMLVMQRAIDGLSLRPELALIDGNRDHGSRYAIETPHCLIVGGDGKSASIAAASILAKVSRDRYVAEVLDKQYPQYQFAKHKGYGTKLHYQMLDRYGPCPEHRETFLKKWEARRRG